MWIGRAVSVFAMVVATFAAETSGPATEISVTDEVLVGKSKRFGINLGAPLPYGAAHYIKNLIPNPGFEAGRYGMVFHVADGATGSRAPQAFWDTRWNNDAAGVGQPEGFWDGAAFEIVYGPGKGRGGIVTRFAHEDNQNVFYLEGEGVAPGPLDVVFVRKETPGVSQGVPDTSTRRPGSPGKQSLRLTSKGEAWKPVYAHYMDSYWRDGDRSAGKLLLIEGAWRLEFWAKGKGVSDLLRVVFKREEETVFFDKTFTLAPEWRKYEVETSVPSGRDRLGRYAEDAYHPILVFAFYLPQDGSEVWVDDVALYRSDMKNPTVFADALVERLRELRPGILRCWAGGFGDTLDNALAEPWARGPFGFKPHHRAAGTYCYSLHEFLELCRLVGAEPWYVLAPTFSKSDLTNLAAYLAAPADEHSYGARRAALGQAAPWTAVFPTMHLEYGNELWGSASGGDPFMGGSVLGGERLGIIANDRLGVLRRSRYFDAAKMDLIIGGQAFYTNTQELIEQRSSNHDTLALAPYFGTLETHQTDQEIYGPLFARPFWETAAGHMRRSGDLVHGAGKGTALAVYEINFHTTEGAAPNAIRNDFVTGAGGALALPLTMLVYLRESGCRNQCAFTTAQYSFRMADGGFVRLWGLMRDLAATGRKRPTWLGLELVNGAVGGALVRTTRRGADPSWRQAPMNGVEDPTAVRFIQSFAFREEHGAAVVLFNLSLEQALPVRLHPPSGDYTRAVRQWIGPSSLHDDNEAAESVRIQSEELDPEKASVDLVLPRHSAHTIRWTCDEASAKDSN